MNSIEQWRQAVTKAANNPDLIEIIARGLHDAEEAKRLLRSAGVGVSGMGILQTVQALVSTGAPIAHADI
jgi:hypothetical protein